jgi:hypothetical protein
LKWPIDKQTGEHGKRRHDFHIEKKRPIGQGTFTTTDGYRSMKRLLQGSDRNSIMNLLKTLHENKEDSP